MHAPLAMLHHWDMMQLNEDMNVNELNSMPLPVTSHGVTYNQLNLFKKLGTQQVVMHVKNSFQTLASLKNIGEVTVFARLLRFIWHIPRRNHSTT